MISSNKIRYIVSLQKRKVREDEKVFVIEGDKIVKEFLAAGVSVKTLVAKPEFLNSLPGVTRQSIGEIIPASYEVLKRISSLTTPHNALAVVNMPEKKMSLEKVGQGLTVLLDCIQDPGNLGTIIRAAAWFGIRDIYCSEDSVDVYNPKVIQSSMGAVLNVNIFYTSLKDLLENASARKVRIFGTMLEGHSVYSHKLSHDGVIILGNESKGISEGYHQYITDKIMIPRLNESKPGIDSLNVSMAASVIFSEFTRARGRVN